jgi:hypothetical protein
MIAGLLLGLVLAHLFRPQAATLPVARAVAWCTVAIGFGGSMTYGQTIGLTQDAPLVGNWAALAWGMLGLAIKGGIWIGFAGVFLGMGLGGRQYRPLELCVLMAGLLALFVIGTALLNAPSIPSTGSCRESTSPMIEGTGCRALPRREVWGGRCSRCWLLGYVALRKRDILARNLGGGPSWQVRSAFRRRACRPARVEPETFASGVWAS